MVRRTNYRVAANLFLLGGICWLVGALFVAAAGSPFLAFAWGMYFGALLWFAMLAPCLIYLAMLGVCFHHRPGSVRLVALGLSPLLAGLPTAWILTEADVLSHWLILYPIAVAVVYGVVVRTPRRYFVGRPATAAS